VRQFRPQAELQTYGEKSRHYTGTKIWLNPDHDQGKFAILLAEVKAEWSKGRRVATDETWTKYGRETSPSSIIRVSSVS